MPKNPILDAYLGRNFEQDPTNSNAATGNPMQGIAAMNPDFWGMLGDGSSTGRPPVGDGMSGSGGIPRGVAGSAPGNLGPGMQSMMSGSSMGNPSAAPAGNFNQIQPGNSQSVGSMGGLGLGAGPGARDMQEGAMAGNFNQIQPGNSQGTGSMDSDNSVLRQQLAQLLTNGPRASRGRRQF